LFTINKIPDVMFGIILTSPASFVNHFLKGGNYAKGLFSS